MCELKCQRKITDSIADSCMKLFAHFHKLIVHFVRTFTAYTNNIDHQHAPHCYLNCLANWWLLLLWRDWRLVVNANKSIAVNKAKIISIISGSCPNRITSKCKYQRKWMHIENEEKKKRKIAKRIFIKLKIISVK